MPVASRPASVGAAVLRGRPTELTAEPAFARRVVRLAATSSVALGLIWLLATLTLDVPGALEASLAVGWLLMPTALLLSLRWPGLRYALVIPSSLVGVPLLATCASALPADPLGSAG